MEANRKNLNHFLTMDPAACTNLGLRLDKLNREIDEEGEHEKKKKMLGLMAGFRMDGELLKAYRQSFKRWKNIMCDCDDRECFEIESTSKVLLGTGNASVFEFGVNLNRPWGVPCISGTTLKGAVSSYLSRYYGENWWRSSENAEKSAWQVEVFGGILKDNPKKQSYIGLAIFADAWLVPEGEGTKNWFATDIINPHYPNYYGEQNRAGEKHIAPPDGMASPVPLPVAALKPGMKFLVVIAGPEKEREFLKRVLGEALATEGIGGKTALGYGRFKVLEGGKKQKPKYQIWPGANVKFHPNTGEIEALFEGKKAYAKEKSLIPEEHHKKLFKKKKSIVLDVKVQEYGNSFKIVGPDNRAAASPDQS